MKFHFFQVYMDQIWEKWLVEGDLRMLLYIWTAWDNTDIGSSSDSEPLRLNLLAQLDAMLDIAYTGEYSYLYRTRAQPDTWTDPNGVVRTALWFYFRTYQYYTSQGDTERAAKVLAYTREIKIRKDPLPLFCPQVVRRVMQLEGAKESS
jgi:hypothetical protein